MSTAAGWGTKADGDMSGRLPWFERLPALPLASALAWSVVAMGWPK